MSFPFQENHGWMSGQVFILKADTTNPYSPKLKAGTKVKCVMVSRFGDVGITTNLKAENGYSNRVMPSMLAKVPDIEYNMVVKVPEGLKRIYGNDPRPQWTLEQLEQWEKEHPIALMSK